ncbi:hypothetical protein ABTI55_19250, partial [Acinetobacter baumannii]
VLHRLHCDADGILNRNGSAIALAGGALEHGGLRRRTVAVSPNTPPDIQTLALVSVYSVRSTTAVEFAMMDVAPDSRSGDGSHRAKSTS